jgi:hypothetical protein
MMDDSYINIPSSQTYRKILSLFFFLSFRIPKDGQNPVTLSFVHHHLNPLDAR